MNSASSFLRRWSQRKLESVARSNAAAPEVVPARIAPAEAPLPDPDALDFNADFSPFMQQEVDSETRRKALRKLFMTDHYRAMDGLDVYVEDYSRPTLLPSDLLQTLDHAQALLQKTEEAVAQAAAEPMTELPKAV